VKRYGWALVCAAIIAMFVPGGTVAQAATNCSKPDSAAGDWPSFGHDVLNTRTQPRESRIGPDNVSDLEAEWAFASTAEGGTLGAFQSTPVEANGCIFMTSASISTPTTLDFLGNPIDFDQYAAGWLFAVDSDTGKLVWRVSLGPVANINFFGGVFAPTVVNGTVYVLIGSGVPSVIALDEQTGTQLWQTNLLDPGSRGALASIRVFDGMIFAPTVGGDGSNANTPFFILDAESGAIIKTTYMYTNEQFIDGHAGGGSWTTPVIDEKSHYAYLGTSNPYGQKEDKFNNSIVKIDVDKNRKTFGEIVGVFKHTRDDDPKRGGDVDFGASPNLFTLPDGRVVVGDLQKSGEYHAVDADTMKLVWTRGLAPASAGGNAATSAVDGGTVYVAPNGGKLYALNALTGATRWAGKYPEDIGHYQPVTIANGVVYTINHIGELVAFDQKTGKLLLKKMITGSTGDCVWSAGGGVAVARGFVYATCDKGGDGGGIVVAYQAP
jgi:outer membrane protein assembly factor BamB